MTLLLAALIVYVLFALVTKSKKNSDLSNELYDYSLKSKDKIRNPHMSMRAMRHRMMKRRKY
jgi:hypothetical protein